MALGRGTGDGGESKHRFLTELIEELLSTPVGTQNLWGKPVLGLVGWEKREQGAVPIPCPHGNPRDAPAPPRSLLCL